MLNENDAIEINVTKNGDANITTNFVGVDPSMIQDYFLASVISSYKAFVALAASCNDKKDVLEALLSMNDAAMVQLDEYLDSL